MLLLVVCLFVFLSLSHAHTLSLSHSFSLSVHRDLKPQNILLKVTENEVIPVISDFGLCRKKPADQSYVTTKYGMAGTLGWTAPELSENTSKVVSAYYFEMEQYNKIYILGT